MKERPIIFSAPMVRAILAGTKTQTRRIVPTMFTCGRVEYPGKRDSRGYSRVNWLDTAEGMAQAAQECKYGRPGDRLWVRETWGAWPHMMGGVQPETLRYRADGEYQNERGTWRWRPSIHMPRWASRITLEITDVRVERLQDISEADAKAEGVSMPDGTPAPPDFWSYQQEFRHLWEQINGPGSWDANPFVWVVTFRRIDHA